MRLPIAFPSEADQLRRKLAPYAGATAEMRLLAAADALAAAEALSKAGGRYAESLAYHERCEQQWRDRMKEFIASHVGPGTASSQ